MKNHKLLLIMLSLFWLSNQASVTDNLKMVWNDEFNGNTLDASKWAPTPEWPRQGGSYWSRENYEMTGTGQVKLTTTERNDSVFCGGIRTHNKFDKKYGFFEVRCKVPQMRGGWAAFWMMPYGNKPGSWGNDGTEIDVFESINGWQGKINHALHWDGYGAEHQKESFRFDRPDLYDNNYHKFGVMWTPEEYIFYIDDQETWRTSAGGVADVNQYLKLTMEVASGWWAGNWGDQTIKPVEWLIDYVRVYDYEPVVQNPLTLNFTSLSNGDSYVIGDQINMDVTLLGDLSDATELQFLVKKIGGEFEVKQTSTITSATNYPFKWIPSEVGTYSLRVTANLNGNYVTHVVVGSVTIKDPVELNYTVLNWGDVYNVGDEVKMHVNITGDLSEVDELRYILKYEDGSSLILKTRIVSPTQTTYWNKWIPTEAGTFRLKVSAYNQGAYITHVTSKVTIKDPMVLKFRLIEDGQVYSVADDIKMHVDVSGDITEADEIRFIVQKNGEKSIIDKTVLTDRTKKVYYNKWVPVEEGKYTLKAKAYLAGEFVTNVIANITVTSSPKIITGTNLLIAEKLIVFPNPTNDKVNVSLSNDQIDELSLVSLEGEVLKHQQNSNTLNMEEIPSGLYMIRVLTADGEHITQLIVK